MVNMKNCPGEPILYKTHKIIYKISSKMNAYLWTSSKDAIVNSIRCKSPVSYLISHYVICQLTVSLSFLKNVVHFSFICQNIIEF